MGLLKAAVGTEGEKGRRDGGKGRRKSGGELGMSTAVMRGGRTVEPVTEASSLSVRRNAHVCEDD